MKKTATLLLFAGMLFQQTQAQEFALGCPISMRHSCSDSCKQAQQNQPYRDVNAIATTLACPTGPEAEGAVLNIRSSRAGAVEYFIDGVRITSLAARTDSLEVIIEQVENCEADVYVLDSHNLTDTLAQEVHMISSVPLWSCLQPMTYEQQQDVLRQDLENAIANCKPNKAPELPYQLKVQSAPYQPLSRLKAKANFAHLEEGVFPIPLPFAFEILGQQVSRLEFDTDWNELNLYNHEEEEIAAFCVFEDLDLDVDRRANFVLGYELLGLPGERILVVEGKNMPTFTNYNIDNKPLFINFQIQLFESTNEVVYHYGPHHWKGIADGKKFTRPATVYFSMYDEINDYSYFPELLGDPQQPILLDCENDQYAELFELPAPGTQYRFVPDYPKGFKQPGQRQLDYQQLEVRQDVLSREILVLNTLAGSSLQLFNLQGQLLQTQPAEAGQTRLSTAGFASGMYLLTVAGTQSHSKIVIP
ncbi:MAG: T9SS type A sorting domain-containing protein [Bacteroidia bacterium]